jgi:hypothetical protein
VGFSFGETSGSEVRKPRPGLLSWSSVGAPTHHAVLNKQSRTLKTKKKISPADV